MARLWHFNPGGELSFARARGGYALPARSVRQLRRELGLLMRFLASEGDYILIFDAYEKPLFYDHQGHPVSTIPEGLSLALWSREQGIEDYIQQRLSPVRIQVSPLLPIDFTLQHRRVSLSLYQRLSQPLCLAPSLAPHWLDSTSSRLEIEEVMQEKARFSPYNGVVIKLPYSSSGRGVSMLRLSEALEATELLHRQIAKRGSLSIEPWLDRYADWAMEWHLSPETEPKLVALSSFFSEGASYQGNRLLPQAELWQQLRDQVGAIMLERTIDETRHWLQEVIEAGYHGYIGIDQMVYKEGKALRWHPVVEVNPRCTMGLIAAIVEEGFRDKFREGFYVRSLKERLPREAVLLAGSLEPGHFAAYLL